MEKKQKRDFYLKKFVPACVIVLFIFLMLSLNSRLSAYYRLNKQRNEVATVVSGLRITEQYLQTQAVYVQSDEAVEAYARSNHQILSGDHPIVPLPKTDETPRPNYYKTPTPEPATNFQIWQELFFGD
jgi:hypothetical protein